MSLGRGVGGASVQWTIVLLILCVPATDCDKQKENASDTKSECDY